MIMVHNRLKEMIKKLIPSFILRWGTGLFYGWHGNYATWAEAERKSSGYNQVAIAEKVRKAILQVKNGQGSFERDSVVFEKPAYNFHLLSSLMWVAAQNKGELNVLDFGGSLGSTCFQHQYFLKRLPFIRWNIVEQKQYVEIGKNELEDQILKFYDTIEECLEENQPNVILLSSVLQYIEKPYDLLKKIMKHKFKFIIFDRTPFIIGKDRITIQKVHPSIYKASYPCWFFNENKLLNYLFTEYSMIFEFEALDQANIKSSFKGFLLMHNDYSNENN